MSVSFAPEELSVPNGFHRVLHDLGKEVLKSRADSSQDICVVAARFLKEQMQLRQFTGRDPYTGEVYHSEETDETAEGEVKKEE
ncbi:hypothetical protein ACHWQZ_G001439 [Mnemiopsis leidyi]